MTAYLSIRSVAERTGLSSHTIRAWERRYRVLTPTRTETNRRLYSEGDVERLSQLRRAVDAGHSIGLIANMPSDELSRLVPDTGVPAGVPGVGGPPTAEAFLVECERAVNRLDGEGLDQALSRAAMAMGVDRALDEVVVPLLTLLDRRYELGSYHMSHEHLLSATLRAFLERVRRSFAAPPSAPVLLVTTPAGQLHEIGALMVCIVSALRGRQVTYLGPNLPAAEIALGARYAGASAVALSIVYVGLDVRLEDELRLLRESLGPETSILAGGRAACEYAEVLKEIGAEVFGDLGSLRASPALA